jgi:hypothetical protein
VPKVGQRGQLKFKAVDYKKITKRLEGLLKYNYLTTKLDTSTYTKDKRYYNNYEQIYKIDKIQINKFTKCLNVRIQDIQDIKITNI